MNPRAAIVYTLIGSAPAHLCALAADGALPFDAHVESVLERGAIEGYDVRVTRFRSPLPPAAATARAREAWSGDRRAPLVESASGAWRIVSRFDGDAYRTLQLRGHADGGSEGMLSVWRAAPLPGGAGLDPAGLLPAGAAILRRFSSVDAGRRAESVVAQVPGSVDQVDAALHDRMTLAGYRRDPVVGARPNVAPGLARLYRRSHREALVTLHPSLGRVGVVLHLTEEAP